MSLSLIRKAILTNHLQLRPSFLRVGHPNIPTKMGVTSWNLGITLQFHHGFRFHRWVGWVHTRPKERSSSAGCEVIHFDFLNLVVVIVVCLKMRLLVSSCPPGHCQGLPRSLNDGFPRYWSAWCPQGCTNNTVAWYADGLMGCGCRLEDDRRAFVTEYRCYPASS